jgi:hypothetical protein
VLEGVLLVGLDEFRSDGLQRLRPRWDCLLATAESNVLMLEAGHVRLVLVAGVTIVSPDERCPVADVEPILANVDCVVARGEVQGPDDRTPDELRMPLIVTSVTPSSRSAASSAKSPGNDAAHTLISTSASSAADAGTDAFIWVPDANSALRLYREDPRVHAGDLWPGFLASSGHTPAGS